jgi:hypothetical protein
MASVPQAAALVSFGQSDLLDPIPRRGPHRRGDRVQLQRALLVAAGARAHPVARDHRRVRHADHPGQQRRPGTQDHAGGAVEAHAQHGLGADRAGAAAAGRVRSSLVLLLLAPGVLVLLLGGPYRRRRAAGGTRPVSSPSPCTWRSSTRSGARATGHAPEDLSVFGALRRSWRLVRRSFWRVLGIMLLTALLVGILSGVISVPFAVISSLLACCRTAPYESFPLTLVQLLVSQLGSVSLRRDPVPADGGRHRAALHRPADADRGPRRRAHARDRRRPGVRTAPR